MTWETFEAIEVNSEKYDLEPSLVAAQINYESRGNKNARGRAGEIGLMQPLTCHYKGNSNDLLIPMINVDVGCRYLKKCREKANGNKKEMLRLYNQGLNGKRRNYKNWEYVDGIFREYSKGNFMF